MPKTWTDEIASFGVAKKDFGYVRPDSCRLGDRLSMQQTDRRVRYRTTAEYMELQKKCREPTKQYLGESGGVVIEVDPEEIKQACRRTLEAVIGFYTEKDPAKATMDYLNETSSTRSTRLCAWLTSTGNMRSENTQPDVDNTGIIQREYVTSLGRRFRSIYRNVDQVGKVSLRLSSLPAHFLSAGREKTDIISTCFNSCHAFSPVNLSLCPNTYVAHLKIKDKAYARWFGVFGTYGISMFNRYSKDPDGPLTHMCALAAFHAEYDQSYMFKGGISEKWTPRTAFYMNRGTVVFANDIVDVYRPTHQRPE